MKYTRVPQLASTKEKYLARIDQQGENECWLWTGAVSPKGPGYLSAEDKIWTSNRLTSWYYHGHCDTRLANCLCHEPLCCNPKHIAVETHKEQQARMKLEGRRSCGIGTAASKLDDTAIKYIRANYKPYCKQNSMPKLAERFSVTAGCVRDILVRKTWQHVE